MTKALAMFGNVVETAGLRFTGLSDKYANELFENMNTGYAEVHLDLHYFLFRSDRK